MARAPPTMIGKLLAHYRILDRLGEGGMGVVYRAEDVRLRRIVALKLLPQRLAESAIARQRLMHEARAASKLVNPHIATIYEIDEAEDQLYVSMEFVEGESLERRLERDPLTIAEVVRFSVQIAEALRAAHEQGVIHRDVKPSNILINSAGQIKLVDFGLALMAHAAVDEASDASSTAAMRLTLPGLTAGTLAYMCPEQAQGRRPDGRGDLFSFGIVLYEMITGTSPFKRATMPATAAAILHDQPEPLGKHRTDVPGSLEEIVHRCLHKDPSKRPASAAEVQEALLAVDPTHGLGPFRRMLTNARAPLIVLAGLVLLAAALWLARETLWPEPPIQDREARLLYEQGQSYESRGDNLSNVRLAEQMYRKALAVEPGSPLLQAELARFLGVVELVDAGNAKRRDEIRQYASSALAANPDLAPAWVARARLLLLENKADEAVQAARQAVAAARDDHASHIVLGEALIAAGQEERGLDELRRAIEIGKGHIWARLRLARLLVDLNRLDEAATEYKKVLDYVPDSPNALNNLAAIHLYRGSYLEAIPLLNRLLQVQPDDYAATNLGTAYFYLERLPEAIAAYSKAVELASQDPVHKQNLAEAYERSGDRVRATEWYEKAWKDYERVRAELGGNMEAELIAEEAFCAAKLGRRAEALNRLAQALARDPECMSCLRSAARVHALVGDRERAYEFIDKAIAAGYPREDFRREPSFHAFQQDPQFLALLTEAGR